MTKKLKYMTCDGNTAAAYASYAFTEVAGIYPITPSSPMADYVDQWAQAGRKNIFGQTVNVIEMQSEGGASGVVHGSLAAGALTTTYTASQGLLLMIPNMYKIAGELLPCVFHISARTLATHALSIFGDHSDVMAARQTGFAMLFGSSVQEVVWMACVAHLSAIKSRVPFMDIFDGFRTSHEIQKIQVPEYDDLAELVDYEAVKEFRERALSPNHPTLRGSAMNPDIFFQVREASNRFYNELPDIVEHYMNEINKLAGTNYKLYDYYGDPEAERVVVCMGSAVEALKETVDFLTAKGEKVGVLNVHLFRPFDTKRFVDALPKTTKKIAVLDRTKEPGAQGEPLFQDVVTAYYGHENPPIIVGGRYGLGSKNTTPGDFLAVFKHLNEDKPRHNFTIGIIDDVSNLSLAPIKGINTVPAGTVSCRFWGLGSDGTVGANKNSIKIIGDHTDMYAQAYFSYDSKKSGGITISDLRFGKSPIHSTYLIDMADFASCSQQSYVDKYDMLSSLKDNGVFLLNTLWTDEELNTFLPASMKRAIATKKIRFYTIDAVEIAKGLGLGGRTNTVMQAAFFKLSNIIPIEEAVEYMKKAIVKSYSKKGDEIVKMNYGAVDAGCEKIHEVKYPADWANAVDGPAKLRNVPEFVSKIADVTNAQNGDSLPVSTFLGMEDGTLPQGTSKYEKRGIAVDVPHWIPENCIQCNQCSYVCPHGVIRPFLVTEEEAAKAPATMNTIKGTKPYDGYKFIIQPSVLDCTGCGSCAQVCPAKNKALVMQPIGENMQQSEHWTYLTEKVTKKPNPMKSNIVKGTQFNMPYFEFSGACAGCGETPYAKLVTQLFGDKMMISNATGCSSIWGGSAPSQPYTTDEHGRGPSWANSLFEDNAEHGLGMLLGAKQLRNRLKEKLMELNRTVTDEAVKVAGANWLDNMAKTEGTIESAQSLVEALSNYHTDNPDEQKLIADIMENKDYLSKRSTWIFGGDGWAYDIGYGGLDHVLSTGEDINVLVFDTEVYSNTGGQASKSTPMGAIAQFAAGGKSVKKKDLGMMAMSYGYVYVAQIAMGANQAQTLKAIAEAEAYHGPSLIIAYSPCINHGIKGGMTRSQAREKQAVECGYWHLYRFNPLLAKEGKNPFVLDSKAPDLSKFHDYLTTEVRYSSLAKKYPPEHVEAVFALAEQNAAERYKSYVRKSQESYAE